MRLRALLVAAALCVAAPAGGDPELGPAERERLDSGDVLVEALEPRGGKGAAARGLAVVDAPPALVWPVVRDCAAFDEFMPRTSVSEERERNGAKSICFTRMDVPFPFGDLESSSRVVEGPIPTGGFERSWELIEGDYTKSEGRWRVLPWGEDGSRSLLVFDQDFEPRSVLPDFILKQAQNQLLPEAMRAVRARVAAGHPKPAGADVAAGPGDEAQP